MGWVPSDEYAKPYVTSKPRKLVKGQSPPYETMKQMLIVERKSYRDVAEACKMSISGIASAFRKEAIRRGEWEEMRARQAQNVVYKRMRRTKSNYFLESRVLMDMVRHEIETGPYDGGSFTARMHSFCQKHDLAFKYMKHRINSTQYLTKPYAVTLLLALGEEIEDPSLLRYVKNPGVSRRGAGMVNGPASKAETG